MIVLDQRSTRLWVSDCPLLVPGPFRLSPVIRKQKDLAGYSSGLTMGSCSCCRWNHMCVTCRPEPWHHRTQCGRSGPERGAALMLLCRASPGRAGNGALLSGLPCSSYTASPEEALDTWYLPLDVTSPLLIKQNHRYRGSRLVWLWIPQLQDPPSLLLCCFFSPASLESSLSLTSVLREPLCSL